MSHQLLNSVGHCNLKKGMAILVLSLQAGFMGCSDLGISATTKYALT